MFLNGPGCGHIRRIWPAAGLFKTFLVVAAGSSGSGLRGNVKRAQGRKSDRAKKNVNTPSNQTEGKKTHLLVLSFAANNTLGTKR